MKNSPIKVFGSELKRIYVLKNHRWHKTRLKNVRVGERIKAYSGKSFIGNFTIKSKPRMVPAITKVCQVQI